MNDIKYPYYVTYVVNREDKPPLYGYHLIHMLKSEVITLQDIANIAAYIGNKIGYSVYELVILDYKYLPYEGEDNRSVN